MTVTVDIKGLGPIAEALDRLARAMGTGGHSASLRIGAETGDGAPQPVQAAPQPAPQGASGWTGQGPTGAIPGPVPTAPPQQPGVPVSQPGYPAQVQGQAAGTVATPGQIPTTALPQGYTQDRIAVAMTGLVDQGKQPQVMQVLAQFGAGSLMQVPKEQYPALATQLRMLGADL